MEIGAVVSTCACCGKAGHEKARCRFRNAKCSNCGKLKAMCRQREEICWQVKSLEQQWQEFWQRRHEPWKPQTSAVIVDRSVIDDLVALRRTESCSPFGKTWTFEPIFWWETRVLGLSRWNPLRLKWREKFQHVCGHCRFCDSSGIPSDVLSVCDNSDLLSDEYGNLLNMIMDPGAEEHVVSLAD